MGRVLIVDDEPDIILVVGKMLERKGYEVASAADGKGCLAKVKAERPDLILLDAFMPGLDGWEVSRQIKEDRKTKGIPVVIYTIADDEKDRKRSYEFAHADFHLDKPAGMGELLRVVERYAGPLR